MKDVIAIDGPAAAGKSTVARLVAEKRGYFYLDTGAMYRAATLQCLCKGVNIDNEEEVSQIVNNIELKFDNNNRIYLDNEDVSFQIRTIPVTANVSKVSSYKSVRDKMTELQRRMCDNGKIVMEGRDIGTVVVPDAKYKFFLDASLQERAQRRIKDIGNENMKLDKIVEEIKKRDSFDSNRRLAPLKKAEDSIYIDTTSMTVDMVVNYILNEIEKMG
ncbi:MAG: (d)CMP kinase [Candidatus Hydrogenedentota bacterium]